MSSFAHSIATTEVRLASKHHPGALFISALVLPDWLTCRKVLNIMVILGFMLNYMLRVNLTISIVSMVLPDNHTSDDNESTASTKCVDSGAATELDSPSRSATFRIAGNTSNADGSSAPLTNVRPPGNRNRNHADTDSHEDSNNNNNNNND